MKLLKYFLGLNKYRKSYKIKLGVILPKIWRLGVRMTSCLGKSLVTGNTTFFIGPSFSPFWRRRLHSLPPGGSPYCYLGHSPRHQRCPLQKKAAEMKFTIGGEKSISCSEIYASLFPKLCMGSSERRCSICLNNQINIRLMAK